MPLSERPPMGFNTWNTFWTDINEKMIFETADAMVSRGFLQAGYNYLVIDDGWLEKERDPQTGRQVPDREKFPHGMKYVADYVHSKGLKFGMYSAAGLLTCQGLPGSMDNEFLDAETFASWDVDYLKYDSCFMSDSVNFHNLFYRMGAALRACGRDIVYSACSSLRDNPSPWIRATGAHLYRTTSDINDNFKSCRNIITEQLSNHAASAPGCWNDMDMLTVGMYGDGAVSFGGSGCSDAEYRTQFAAWCMMASPLMLGCDVRKVSETARALLCNRELIAINQDVEGRPAYECCGDTWQKDCLVCVKLLANNEYALAFFNFSEDDSKIHFFPSVIGLPYYSKRVLDVTDIFSGEHIGEIPDGIRLTVAPHDCRVLKGRLINK